MTDLARSINRIGIKDAASGYDTEYSEHYKSVLTLVGDAVLADKIVKAIVSDHLRESAFYYEYLEKMEREMI
jgi:hypothetical protein